MEIISLLVKTRRGKVVNQTQLIDVDCFALPPFGVASNLDTQFDLWEGPKVVETYIVDQTVAQVVAMSGNLFLGTVTSVRGRHKSNVVMAFNVNNIAGRIIPSGTGSMFEYQESSDPALVEYVVSENPAAILAQTWLSVNPSFEKAITAHVGGGQANAYQLTKDKSRIDTNATNGNSVKMMAAIAGSSPKSVLNNTAKDVDVFPALGENFLGVAANTAITIIPGEQLNLFSYETGVWTY